MMSEIFAFGEILWDCLPSGRYAGGAPFNVSAHLAQLGASSCLISAVGLDSSGDELLQTARDQRVDVRFVSRARSSLTTGTVIARVDPSGNAAYEIVQPVAWDEIQVTDEGLEAVSQADALIFGSLAGRSPYNLEQLDRLLAVPGPVRFFDANLRPPFVNPRQIVEFARRADVLKLNHDELGLLADYLQAGSARPHPPVDVSAVAKACGTLADATSTARICVTMGATGALLWDGGSLIHAPAPSVTVCDTVGAGDAFMAALVLGLTRGTDQRVVLDSACRLGAYVASQRGAVPTLPPEMTADLIESLNREASATGRG